MRIGIDGRLWNETGVGRYTRALVSHLQAIDVENEYILFLIRKDYERVELKNKNWRKAEANIRWHTFSEQIRLPYVFAKENLDLLHLPYFSVPIFTSIPFVVTIHDLTISHFATGKATTKSWPEYQLKRLGYHFVLRAAIAKAQKIITVSETVKKDILSQFQIDPEKVIVTHESGELELATEDKNYTLKLPKEFILYVGNAHPHKNVETLIRAFQILLFKNPRLKLVLVGRRDFFYTRLQKFVAHVHMNQNVEFLGEVSHSQLSQVYKKARCFVFPSLAEGFGIPGLEAMWSDCPVVVSDIPVFHEVYQTAARYFRPTDIQHMADIITSVLENKTERDDLIKQGKKVAKQYSWEKMARETLALYENCTRV